MKKTLRSQKGIAMLMALMTMTVLGILVAELVYQTEVYHRVVFGQVDQLRAKYLAKAGIKLALLQLQAAQKAKDKIKSLGADKDASMSSLSDRIWQTPIILPPPVPKELTEVDKDNIKTFVDSLELNGRIAITISGEAQKMNLNSMVWMPDSPASSTKPNIPPTPQPTNPWGKGGDPVGGNSGSSSQQASKDEMLKSQRQLLRDTIDSMIQNKKQEDDTFREKYQNLNTDVLMGNLLAWMDPNTPMDGDNRNKEDYYSRLPNPYSPKNAPLSSLSELYMVKGFDDTLVSLFADNFTTLSTSGININTMNATLLRSLLPALSPGDAEKVIDRRNDLTKGGPYTSLDDFWNYLNTFGDFKEAKNELTKKGVIFTTEDTAYRVSIEASSGYAKKSWVAYVGDPPPAVQDPNNPTAPQVPPKPPNTPQGAGPSTTNNDIKVPSIIYLKAE